MRIIRDQPVSVPTIGIQFLRVEIQPRQIALYLFQSRRSGFSFCALEALRCKTLSCMSFSPDDRDSVFARVSPAHIVEPISAQEVSVPTIGIQFLRALNSPSISTEALLESFSPDDRDSVFARSL